MEIWKWNKDKTIDDEIPVWKFVSDLINRFRFLLSKKEKWHFSAKPFFRFQAALIMITVENRFFFCELGITLSELNKTKMEYTTENDSFIFNLFKYFHFQINYLPSIDIIFFTNKISKY